MDFVQAMPPQPSHSKRKFTPEEDDRLTQIVTRLGESNWKKIASQMGSRNSRQCRERWKNYLTPCLNKDPWSPEEDALLLQKFSELGSQWSLIAKFFPLRTDVNIKNRWVVLNGPSTQPRRVRRKHAMGEPPAPPPPPPPAEEARPSQQQDEGLWTWAEAEVRQGFEEASVYGAQSLGFFGFYM
jgi:hypothetical protein